jgi:hypothetical protein
MSPIQKPLIHLIENSISEVLETPGCVIVKFRFLTDQIFSEGEMTTFEE